MKPKQIREQSGLTLVQMARRLGEPLHIVEAFELDERAVLAPMRARLVAAYASLSEDPTP